MKKPIIKVKEKKSKMKKTFICEICHCETPVECEGSEPNTCAMCMPVDYEFLRHYKAQKEMRLNNLSAKQEKPCQRAKNGFNGGVYGN